MSFAVVRKDDEIHASLTAASEEAAQRPQNSRTFINYNDLITAYNQRQVGEFIVSERSPKTIGDLRKQLAKRGLVEGVNVLTFNQTPNAKPEEGVVNYVVIKRLDLVEGHHIDQGRKGRPRKEQATTAETQTAA